MVETAGNWLSPVRQNVSGANERCKRPRRDIKKKLEVISTYCHPSPIYQEAGRNVKH
jgi:hypothetical protein